MIESDANATLEQQAPPLAEGATGGSAERPSIGLEAVEELRKQVEAAQAMAKEARELAASFAERVNGTSRTSRASIAGAQGPRLEPDASEQLAQAARVATRSGDRRWLLDYLAMKRAMA